VDLARKGALAAGLALKHEWHRLGGQSEGHVFVVGAGAHVRKTCSMCCWWAAGSWWAFCGAAARCRSA
jgi:hypothetical protein